MLLPAVEVLLSGVAALSALLLGAASSLFALRSSRGGGRRGVRHYRAPVSLLDLGAGEVVDGIGWFTEDEGEWSVDLAFALTPDDVDRDETRAPPVTVEPAELQRLEGRLIGSAGEEFRLEMRMSVAISQQEATYRVVLRRARSTAAIVAKGDQFSELRVITLRFEGLGAAPVIRPGEIGADSDFRDLAGAHGRRAGSFQALAFGLYLAAGLLGSASLFFLGSTDSTGELVRAALVRVSFTAGLLALGVYAARLAAYHRGQEEVNRGIAETLRVKRFPDDLPPDRWNDEIHRTVALFTSPRGGVAELPLLPTTDAVQRGRVSSASDSNPGVIV